MFRAGLTLGICTTPHSLSWTNIRTPKALRTCRTPTAKTDALDCHRQESKGKAPVEHTGRVKNHIVSCSYITLKYARSGRNTVCSPYSTVNTHTHLCVFSFPRKYELYRSSVTLAADSVGRPVIVAACKLI